MIRSPRALPWLLALVLLAAAGAAPAPAQMPEGVVRDPPAAAFHYDDLARFGEALAELEGAESRPDTVRLLDSLYLSRASAGLRVYAGMYGLDGESLAQAIRERPSVYRRVAEEAAAAARAQEPAIREAYARLGRLIPRALFPPVWYLVAHRRAGGAVQREGVLIAVEVYAEAGPEAAGADGPGAGAPNADAGAGAPATEPDALGNDLADLTHLVVHELVHYQQAAADPEHYRSTTSLLARAIKEGTADLVAEMASGGHINRVAHAYGTRDEWELWRHFRCEMRGTETGDWFFGRPERQGWPQDLGYFVGYRIAEAYLGAGESRGAALAELLRAPDYEEVLEVSGYEEALARRAGRDFPACREAAAIRDRNAEGSRS